MGTQIILENYLKLKHKIKALVLINGTNFIDGVNTLVVGHFVLIFSKQDNVSLSFVPSLTAFLQQIKA